MFSLSCLSAKVKDPRRGFFFFFLEEDFVTISENVVFRNQFLFFKVVNVTVVIMKYQVKNRQIDLYWVDDSHRTVYISWE